MSTSVTITLPSAIHTALQTAAADSDELRFYMSSICFDFDKRRMVATNGHRLLVVPFDGIDGVIAPVPESMSGQVLVPLTPRKCPKEGTVIVSFDGDAIVATMQTKTDKVKESFALKPVDGKYPDVDKVIPDPAGKQAHRDEFAFNPLYLYDVPQALNENGYPCVRPIAYGDCLGAFRVAMHGSPSSIDYIVMPCRW